jgi:hypothetical protein
MSYPSFIVFKAARRFQAGYPSFIIFKEASRFQAGRATLTISRESVFPEEKSTNNCGQNYFASKSVTRDFSSFSSFSVAATAAICRQNERREF